MGIVKSGLGSLVECNFDFSLDVIHNCQLVTQRALIAKKESHIYFILSHAMVVVPRLLF